MGHFNKKKLIIKQKISQARSELFKRYDECDSQGHRQPNFEKNYCDYCFRHLSYTAPPAFRSDLLQVSEEIRIQKQSEYLEGLSKLERGM